MRQLLILKENTRIIRNAEEMFKNIKRINIEYEQENFIATFLDTKNNIINSEIIFKGGLNSCIIDLKTIFRKALLNNANNMIVSHNHPSGDLNPSSEDRDIYKKLRLIGEELGLRVLDSIIFNKEEFYSLADVSNEFEE